MRQDKRYLAWARLAPGPKGRKPVYSRVSQEEADRLAREMEEAAKAPEPTPYPSGSFDPRRFAEGSFGRFVYYVWMPHVYPSKRKTTIRKYDGLLVQHILPALAFLPIREIGYDEVKRMADGLTRKDKRKAPMSPAQRAEVVMRTREILKLHNMLAQARGETTREDWRLVPIPAKPKKKKREEVEPGFTEKLLDACEPWEKGPHFAALFLGLRRGEVCGLRWSRIDRKRLRITVCDQLQPEYGAEVVPTKGEERTIPIPFALLRKLEELGDPKSDYVFTWPRPGKGRHKAGHKPPMLPILPNELSKRTPKLCAKAEIKAVTFHDLRSFAASNLAALGTDPYAIMEILGHAEIDTSTIYVNSKDEKKREALERLLDTLTA